MKRILLALLVAVSAGSIAENTLAAPMTTKVVEYESPAVARRLKYRIALPADYETSGKRYPVLYLLHGFSGDYTSWNKVLPEKAAEPYDLILVQPDGGNSWYVNWSESAPGQKNNWEDAIIKDLIGHVDARFRTIAGREGRAINGMSMGSYGALTLGLRNPGIFCSIAGQSGLIDWARGFAKKLKADPNAILPERKPEKKLKAAIGLPDFDDQEERTPRGRIFKTVAECDAHDPYVLAATKPVATMPHIYFDCGTEDGFFGYNQDLLKILIERKIPFTYAQSPGAHTYDYWRREFGLSLAVQYEIIRRGLAEKTKTMPNVLGANH